MVDRSRAVHLLHGVVNEKSRDLQVHRLYTGREALKAFLRARPQPYGTLSDPHADVLTVDDATVAGAEACLAAMELGHHVVFFVNPSNVVRQIPYFFSLLDLFIDRRAVDHATFEGSQFELLTKAQRRAFRIAVRTRLMGLEQDEAGERVNAVGLRLGASAAELPRHMAPISVKMLRTLVDAGVQVENHGWDHKEIGAMNLAEFKTHVKSAADWFASVLGSPPSLYAPPFGRTDLTAAQRSFLRDPYFLADDDRMSGEFRPGCWNRVDITALVDACDAPANVR